MIKSINTKHLTKPENRKRFDLEERTLTFAKNIRNFIKQVPKSITNIEYVKQLTRSSGSVGANYIEANESISKKDFIFRIKICRQECKESRYWLELVHINSQEILENRKQKLIQESTELMNIFGSILRKVT